MATIIEARNGVESLAELGKELLLSKRAKAVAPRGQMTHELEDMTIVVYDPTDVLMTGIGRNWNSRLAALEALQLIGGVSLPEKMVAVAPNTKAFLNDDGIFDGAYGPRVSNQMYRVIQELTKDPLSRRAQAVIWRLDELERESRDYPCTISLGFRLRNGRLTMKTHMRSNDVWWGWCYDLFQFASLQLTVANVLGAEVGPYVHHADSFHVYTRDIGKLGEVMDRAQVHVGAERERINGVSGATWDLARSHANSLLFHGPNLDQPFYSAQKLWEV